MTANGHETAYGHEPGSRKKERTEEKGKHCSEGNVTVIKG